MDTTHLHLLLNHFPIIGTLIAIVTLTYGVISESRRTTKISLAVIVVMSLITIPVFLTGEPAEDSVKNLAGVSKAIIEEHEEAAELAVWFMALLGVLSAVTLASLIVSERINKILVWSTVFAGIITFGLMARTGYLGGLIRHTEIRSETQMLKSNSGDQDKNHSNEDDD